MAQPQKITPFLWFDSQAEEAANFYVTLLPDSKVLSVTRYPEGAPVPPGTVMTAEFRLAGITFTAMNGGPHFKLNEAFSIMVHCDGQAEVDALWEKLTANGGQESQCGWLKDRFGLSWQIVPREFFELMKSGTPAQSQAVMGAMLKMKKFDVAGLQRAFSAGA